MGEDAHRHLTNDDTDRLGLVIGLVIGVPLMLVGVVGLVRHTDATPPSSYLKFFVGGDIVHDAIIAPIAGLVAYLILRRVPGVARGPLRALLFAAAIFVAIAWPGIRMYGRMRAPDNATVQPLNYATSTLTAILVVTVIAAAWIVCALLLRRRAREHSQHVPSSDS